MNIDIPFVFAVAAFTVAALSGMGLGSAGLFVTYLTLIENIPQLEAQGTNLIFFLFAAGASLLIHLQKRKIAWQAVIVMALSGMIGSFIGSVAAPYVGGNILRKAFGAMLLFSGLKAIFAKRKDVGKSNTSSNND